MIISYHEIRGCSKNGWLGEGQKCTERITSHILFTFVDDERIASMWLLGLGARLILDKSYSFDGTEPSKLTFQVGFFNVVAQTADEQSLRRITFDFGVFIGLVSLEIFLLDLFQPLGLLQSLSITLLQPRFCRMIHICLFVLFELGKECSYPRELRYFDSALVRCGVLRRDVFKRRSRLK